MFMCVRVALVTILTATTLMWSDASALDEAFKPDGVIAGSFNIFPKAEVGYSSDDNIFAIQDNAVDDTILTGDVGLEALSDWANHAFNIRGNGKIASYTDRSDEDYFDFELSADGRLDIKRDIFVSYGAGVERLHEERGSANDEFGLEPTKYSVSSTNIGFTHEVSVVTLKVEGTVQKFAYDDTPTSAGVDIANGDRDRTQVTTLVRLGYKIDRNYEAFVRGIYNTRDYAEEFDRHNLQRTSTGYSLVGGVKVDFTGVTAGEFFIGTRLQDYDDKSLGNISGLDFGASLLWTPSELTDVKVFVRRTVEESIFDVTSGFFSTIYGASVEHSILDNLILHLGASTTNWDYEGTNRNDDIVNTKIGAKYFAVSSFYLEAEYLRKRRSSTEARRDYTRNVFLLRIGSQL